MKIGILQTGHSPDELRADQGDYADLFQRLLAGHGFEFRTWSVVDNEMPDSVTEADGWLITGSRHGVYEDHPWIPPLEAFIRAIYADGRPLVGVCFGHQIVAQALGGRVEKYAGGWAVGRQEYTLNGRTVPLNAWHQDQVTALPPDTPVTVIGSHPFCDYAALLYDSRILTVQPHPEFGADFIDGLIRTRGRGMVPDPLLKQAANRLDQPVANDVLAGQIAAFFKQAGAT